MQGAMLVTAKRVAILVHMPQAAFLAPAAHDFCRPPAGDPLRRLIPKNNPAIRIGNIRAISQQIQEFGSV